MPEATQARQRFRPKVHFGIKKVHLWGQEAIPPVRCILESRQVRLMVKNWSKSVAFLSMNTETTVVGWLGAD